ncbi:hypothetical protein OMK64_10000 [Cellulomonas fimi]|uniref:hypothetical protein n=1 Tax=Cellulomonas fimi TaxID=1708 RepID=UPI00234CD51B|nr:hypothetical protein [Cellulomonas fimi]MDC7121867.1 hypothetical protein [Cellulomonas fimi]
MSRRSAGPRRTPAARSWLDAVESASAAFTGTARLTDERPVPAGATPFRGDGFALDVEVVPDQPVFGTAPDGPLTVGLVTARPPDRREPPGAPRFPPDSLREIPYADQALPGADDAVLVVATDPVVVRGLLLPDDDLPAAIATIRGWVDARADEATVLRDLVTATSPVAVVAGFELLLRTTDDVAGLIERFLRLPGLPGGAVRGIVALLHARPLTDAETVDVATRLLGALADTHDPEALVAYLGWFDAHRGRYGDDVAVRVRVQVARVVDRTFDGPDGDAWHQEVARYAEPFST